MTAGLQEERPGLFAKTGKIMGNNIFSYFIIFLASGLFTCTRNGISYKNSNITVEEIKSNIEYLASDELMGREPGHPGIEKAANYITEKFKSYGVKIIPATSSYFQKIKFEKAAPPHEASLSFLNSDFRQNENLIQIAGPSLTKNLEFVYLDYAATAEEYAGISLKNKILITKLGGPGLTGRSIFNFSDEKNILAQQNGALALIEIPANTFDWNGLASYFGHTRTILSNPESKGSEIPHFYLSDPEEKITEKLKNNSDGAIRIDTPGFASDSFYSSNIMGFIPGTNPEKSDEFIVLCAHYDHIGAGLHKRGASVADSIFNGARDNGMGVVALLAAAKHLAQNPAQRPVLVLALTAEESGLQGSRFFTTNSPILLKNIVFALNNDGAGMTDDKIATLVGFEKTTAKEAIRQGVKQAGLLAASDPVPHMNLFERSDNISFAKLGIPATTMSPGFHQFSGALSEKYHKVNDEVDADFSIDYLHKYSLAYAFAAQAIANMDNKPEWVDGEKYQAAASELYKND
ncbi:MAG: hypothetical protein DWQ05_04145 [Calditrichaeota bacterium]|nr:MAG: hypothetical protein DWQ05_04145 [Calditrichota bacterium]